MIETIVLLKRVQLLLQGKAVTQLVPSVLFVADFLLELGLDHFEPVILLHDGITITLFEAKVELPSRLLLRHGLFDLLFLEVFALELFSLLLCQFDLLDFRRLLGPDSLELHSGTLVAELGHCVSKVQLYAVLLVDVVKG